MRLSPAVGHRAPCPGARGHESRPPGLLRPRHPRSGPVRRRGGPGARTARRAGGPPPVPSAGDPTRWPGGRRPPRPAAGPRRGPRCRGSRPPGGGRLRVVEAHRAPEGVPRRFEVAGVELHQPELARPGGGMHGRSRVDRLLVGDACPCGVARVAQQVSETHRRCRCPFRRCRRRRRAQGGDGARPVAPLLHEDPQPEPRCRGSPRAGAGDRLAGCRLGLVEPPGLPQEDREPGARAGRVVGVAQREPGPVRLLRPGPVPLLVAEGAERGPRERGRRRVTAVAGALEEAGDDIGPVVPQAAPPRMTADHGSRTRAAAASQTAPGTGAAFCRRCSPR